MGYSTQFQGELRFAKEPSAKVLAALNSYFGEDARDHPEWGNCGDLCYIDLRLLEDFSGIEWDNETEKTRGLVEAVNLITNQIRAELDPEFRLTGSLLAQGEDADDRWMLVMDDSGKASKQEVVITGQKVKCPRCEHKFRVESVG